MPLYRWNADNLEPVTPTTFEGEGIQEADLQRLVRDQPDVLEEGLFIISEEFGDWRDSYRSIDLLALDKKRRLVVAELKRTQTGDHSELQAIRYAAMVANMTLEQIVEAHRSYLSKRGVEEDAREQVLGHLEATDESEADVRTESPRIILASAGFSKELTTSVLWLRDGGMDISCVKLQLYNNKDGLLMDTMQMIPLPEASDYLVKVREKQEEARQQRILGRRHVPGDSDFVESIKEAQENVRKELTRLHTWAVNVEKEGLTELSTFLGKYTLLQLKLPTANSRPVAIFNTRVSSYLRIGGEALGAHAPQSLERIKKIVHPRIIGVGNTVQEPSDELLDALTDAYREANGLPPTTPRAGSGPDSPPQAE